MPQKSITAIQDALVHQKPADVDMTAEETCKLVNYDEKARNLHATGGQEADDDDDEDEGNGQGQRVQCNQQ
jgi:hypothetical protein